MPATSVSLQPRRRKLAANLFGDLEVLRRKWSAALKPGQALPPFEEIMLGSLGRLADHIMLLQVRTGDAMVMMRAGHYVRRWLGTDANDVPLEQLPADCVTALRHLTTAARTSSAPASSTAYRVRDGAVETYDVLALPLANRWGAPLVALYVCERGSRFDLVDSIYRSTDEGMIALAALRHPNSGTPVDFQILDLNESAARLLATPAVDLRWRKLGDLANALSGAETVARLRSTLSTGRREKFELRVETSSGSAILRVGATATGDLVCATLSDVTEIKRSEESTTRPCSTTASVATSSSACVTPISGPRANISSTWTR